MTAKSIMPSLWSEDEKSEDVFASLHKEIDRVFGEFESEPLLPSWKQPMASWAPKIDVSETESEIRICAELPGVEQKNIHVELSDDILTLSGEKKSSETENTEQKGRKFHRIERSFGSFQRSLRIPYGIDADKVQALFRDGVLIVTVAKPAELSEKTSKIEVKSTS